MDVWEAVEAFDELLMGARVVPLTPEVRVERAALDEAVARLRSADGAPPDAVARIEGRAAGAKPVPLTDQVRIDAREMRRELEAARTEIRRARSAESPVWAALDTLERLVRAGKRGLLGGPVKVDRRAYADALGTVRTQLTLHGVQARSLGALQELAQGGDGDRLRIAPAAFDTALADVRRELAAG